MVYAMEFAERLRVLMAERGISERELARQAHCDRSYVHLLKQGKRRAGRRMAQLLDDALGASGSLAALADRDRASSRSAEGMPSVPPPDLPALAWLVGRLDRRVSRRTAQGFAATLADIHDGGMGDTAERLAYPLANRTGLTGDTVGDRETRSLGVPCRVHVLLR